MSDYIASIMSRIDPSGSQITQERLRGGMADVFRVNLHEPDRSFILKLHPLEFAWRARKEEFILGLVEGRLPVATQACVLIDDTCTSVPRPFVLLSHLPGEALRHWQRDPGIDGAYLKLGGVIRQFHDIKMGAYGYLRGDRIEKPYSDNASYMAYAFERAFTNFLDLGGDTSLMRRLERAVKERMDLVAESQGPVLCHDDFHQGNVLAQRAGTAQLELTGLIDFANGRAADPLFDLAKALFCLSHEDPKSAKVVRSGYGQSGHSDMEGALWLYTLHHRVSMWAWLTKTSPGHVETPGTRDLLRDLHSMLTESE